VALIPTKERVHAPWILERSDLPGYEELRAAVRAEEEADREIRQYLDARGIRYLDLTVPMREAAAIRTIYPPHEDGHPVAAGYAVIADAVAGAIRPWTAGSRRVDQ
jgi:lysophospholipase L1-like esterase